MNTSLYTFHISGVDVETKISVIFLRPYLSAQVRYPTQPQSVCPVDRPLEWYSHQARAQGRDPHMIQQVEELEFGAQESNEWDGNPFSETRFIIKLINL